MIALGAQADESSCSRGGLQRLNRSLRGASCTGLFRYVGGGICAAFIARGVANS
jgi:hypothetical protein